MRSLNGAIPLDKAKRSRSARLSVSVNQFCGEISYSAVILSTSELSIELLIISSASARIESCFA